MKNSQKIKNNMRNLEENFVKEISCRSAHWEQNSLLQVLINKHLQQNYSNLETQKYHTQIGSRIVTNKDRLLSKKVSKWKAKAECPIS